VFFIDGDGHAVCLDADTGQPEWRKNYNGVWKDVDRLKFRRVVSCDGDFLITSGQARSCVLQGISASGGRHLWSFEYTEPHHNFRNSAKNAFILDGLIWVNRQNPSGIPNDTSWVALEPSTGAIKKNIPYGPAIHRCRPAQATERFFFCGSFDVCNRQTGAFHRIRAARNSCGFGVLPANGLVYSFPQSCECDAFLRGCLAFTSSESNHQCDAQDAPNRQPLVKGPAFAWAAEARTAFDVKAAEKASVEAWPCYRHDDHRSGATQALVSADLRDLWKVQIDRADSNGRDLCCNTQAGNDPISAPVVATGMVFVAGAPDTLDPQGGLLIAYFVETGEPLAKHTLDAPPVFDGMAATAGRLFLSTRDGRLLCFSGQEN